MQKILEKRCDTIRRHWTKPFCHANDAFNVNCSLLTCSPMDGRSLTGIPFARGFGGYYFPPSFPYLVGTTTTQSLICWNTRTIDCQCGLCQFLDVVTGQDKPSPSGNYRMKSEGKVNGWGVRTVQLTAKCKYEIVVPLYLTCKYIITWYM